MSGAAYSGAALKRSAWHFFSGKAASALLTFLILLWVVRLLPVVEYGVYVTLVAGMELAIIVATLGLPWLAARYLPEFRLHAMGPRLRHLVHSLLVWHTISLAGVVTILVLGLGLFLAWADLSTFQKVAQTYLLVVLIEGIGRQVRESLLGPLLLQGIAQTSMVARNLLFLALLTWAALSGQASLMDVVQAELAASIVGTLWALAGLARRLKETDAAQGLKGWQEPHFAAMWRTAGHMYFSHLLTMLYSPQVFLLLIQRYLGAESAAVFGFMRTLYEQIARYLPATMLFGLVRPKLVASYVGGGVNELSRNANMAGKLSLFVLMPLVAIAGVAGQELISLLSDAKFLETGWLLFGFMLVLIPFSQRQLLETVAVAAGYSHLCTRAAASGLLMLPLMIGLLAAGLGQWAAVLTMGLGHLVFNSMILAGIVGHAGFRPDTSGVYKLLAAALAGYLGAAWLPAMHPDWVRLIIVALLVSAIFLLVAWWVKPFAEDERERLNRLLKRRLFIW